MQFFEDKIFLEQNYEWNNEYGLTAKLLWNLGKYEKK